MRPRCRKMQLAAVCFAWVLGTLASGCQTVPLGQGPSAAAELPRELAKVSMPPYLIEPPDLLQIDAIRVVPLPPHRLEPLDQIAVRATGVLATEPIGGVYPVEPDGNVNLGFSYGTVQVAGLTTTEAKAAVEKHLLATYTAPKVDLILFQSRGLQQIRGEHLVRPDGTIALGTYGSVYVTGLTLQQTKTAVEEHLSQFLLKPEVSVDVLAYNSKVFYIISDGGGNGQQVVRLPATGNETVLDAMAQIGGLSAVASKHHIWIARPAPSGCREQILPVDWPAIVKGAATCTNYQVLPGDRIYVEAQALVTMDIFVNKVTAPFERIGSFILFNNSLVRAIQVGRGVFNGFGGGTAVPVVPVTPAR
jgi:polysaccharide export outer membrane protein